MKRLVYALPFIALVLFAGLGLVQLFDGTKPGFQRTSRAAPAIALERLDGAGPVAFDTLGFDAPVIVNLWASWCTPCLAEHPLLMSLSERYPGRLYGVVFDDSEENARAFLARHGNPFDVIAMDPTGQGALEFGHTGVPETFVISDGEITLHLRGQLTPDSTRGLIEAIELRPASGKGADGP